MRYVFVRSSGGGGEILVFRMKSGVGLQDLE